MPAHTAFCAKNKDTRNADDVMRASSNAFPMFKPTYASIFYKSLKDCDVREKFYYGIAKKNHENVRKERDDAIEDINFAEKITKLIKEQKTGNCAEAADIALMGLLANGYYKSQSVGLECEVGYIDKNTGETVWSYCEPIDHACVLTDMNNPKRKYVEDLIVVDPWLNRSGSVSEMREKYKKIFLTDKKMQQIKYNLRQRFGFEFSGDNLKNKPDLTNCAFSTKIVFYTSNKYETQEAKEIGKRMAEKYPELVIKRDE